MENWDRGKSVKSTFSLIESQMMAYDDQKFVRSERDKIAVERRQFWQNAWCAAASVSECTKPSTATKWADEALQDFDERFGYSAPAEKASGSGVKP